MAIAPVRIPALQASLSFVDKEGRLTPSALRSLNDAFRALVTNANDTTQALAAAGIALAAADTATDAAAVANAAAASATGAADDAAAATALANSYVEGLTISAEDIGSGAQATISNHTRVYATTPTSSVSVIGGVIGGLAYDTTYYFYYDQPSRSGGAVTYMYTTNLSDVAQINDRHSVASVLTPAAAAPPNDGGGVRPPGGSYDLL